jgi:hypothetical protein
MMVSICPFAIPGQGTDQFAGLGRRPIGEPDVALNIHRMNPREANRSTRIGTTQPDSVSISALDG